MPALSGCEIYGIMDLGYVKPEAVPRMTRELVQGGVDILQLRAKTLEPGKIEELARLMIPITRESGVPLVINDHPEIAAIIGAEGVHIGQGDASVAWARRIVGRYCFIGKSTHSLDQARAAVAEGADYIGFGPLYATGTKPDYEPIGLAHIPEVHALATTPVFCIGGINLDRLPEVVSAGAKRVVIVSAFLLAEDVQDYVRRVKRALSAER